MALETSNRIHAAAVVNGATPPNFVKQDGCLSVVRNGVGDYSITLQQAIIAAEAVVLCTSRNNSRTFQTVHTSDTVKQILCFDSLGAPADCAFDMLIAQFAGPAQAAGVTGAFGPNPGASNLILRGTVLVGDVGAGTSGSVTVTGNIVSASKANLAAPIRSVISVVIPALAVPPDVVLVSVESLGVVTDDNKIQQVVVDNKGVAGFDIFLEDSAVAVKDLRLDIAWLP